MLKIIAGQVLTHNSKSFHWQKKKTEPRTDSEWIVNTILKNSDTKIEKKQKKN